MMAPTHSVFGILLAALIFSVLSVPVMKDPAGLGLVILGSLLPDIDTRHSFLGRMLWFISRPVEERWGHRDITHSLFALLGIALVFIPLFFLSKIWWLCLFLGYLSHILIDSVNKRGTPLFWPSRSRFVFPSAERLRIRTGSLQSEGVLLGALIVLIVFFLPVSNLGLFRTFRYIAANQRSAYTDYKSTTTRTLLEFKGLIADSRQPVQGTAPILEADPQRFIIYYEGRAVTYGEKGEIIPRTSRVRILSEPLDFAKKVFKDQPLSSVLSAAGSGFVSGKLESGTDFDLSSASPSIYSQGRELIFNYADSASLDRVSVHRKDDEPSLSRLESDIVLLQSEILALQSQLPENMIKRLSFRLASLSSRRRSLANCLLTETEPVARMTLQDEIQMIYREELGLKLRISSLDPTDPALSFKIQTALYKLTRMKEDYENAAEDEVLFSGQLNFRRP